MAFENKGQEISKATFLDLKFPIIFDLIKKIPPNYYTNLGVTNQNYIDRYIFSLFDPF